MYMLLYIQAKPKGGSGPETRVGEYVVDLVKGPLYAGKAQEARAKQIAAVGTDGKSRSEMDTFELGRMHGLTS